MRTSCFRVDLHVLLLLACGACKSLAEQNAEQPQPAGSAAVSSAGESGGREGDGTAGGGGQSTLDAAGSETSPDAGPSEDSGSGQSDAGEPVSDAGPGPEPESDAALPDAGALPETGACCSEHETPGCSDADVQVCVCELLSSCCTDAWSEACVLIVEQKYCQAGVRDCVCGAGEGQWGQTMCCESEWSDTFCDEVAESKCGAVPGCF